MVFFLGLLGTVSGFIIVIPLFEKGTFLKKFDERVSPYKILIGIATIVVGVIKLIIPYHGSGHPLIPIFGDFLPSVIGVFAGLLISIDYLETLKGFKGSFFEGLKSFLNKYNYPLGFGSLFIGFIHWIFYKAPLF